MRVDALPCCQLRYYCTCWLTKNLAISRLEPAYGGGKPPPISYYIVYKPLIGRIIHNLPVSLDDASCFIARFVNEALGTSSSLIKAASETNLSFYATPGYCMLTASGSLQAVSWMQSDPYVNTQCVKLASGIFH